MTEQEARAGARAINQHVAYGAHRVYAVVRLPHGTEDYRRVIGARTTHGSLRVRCLATGKWYACLRYDLH